jgi:hypothetical protein
MTSGTWLGLGIGACLVLAATVLGIGRLTGWRQLAGSYPAAPLRSGPSLLLGRAWFRWTGYAGLVRLNADEHHLHFSLWLRLGHPRFSVPWNDIHAEQVPHWRWGSLVRFSFGRTPGIALKLLGVEADRVIAASGGRIRVAAIQEPA